MLLAWACRGSFAPVLQLHLLHGVCKEQVGSHDHVYRRDRIQVSHLLRPPNYFLLKVTFTVYLIKADKLFQRRYTCMYDVD